MAKGYEKRGRRQEQEREERRTRESRKASEKDKQKGTVKDEKRDTRKTMKMKTEQTQETYLERKEQKRNELQWSTSIADRIVAHFWLFRLDFFVPDCVWCTIAFWATHAASALLGAPCCKAPSNHGLIYHPPGKGIAIWLYMLSVWSIRKSQKPTATSYRIDSCLPWPTLAKKCASTPSIHPG